MTGMGMRIHPRIRPAIRCLQCGSTDGHYSDCLQLQLDNLVKQQKHIECPKCGAHDVDVNLDDYYECRQCHMQCTTSDRDESFERVQLIIDYDAPLWEGMRPAQVLPTKGKGEFRIDQSIVHLQKEIEARAAKKTRKRKKPSQD